MHSRQFCIHATIWSQPSSSLYSKKPPVRRYYATLQICLLLPWLSHSWPRIWNCLPNFVGRSGFTGAFNLHYKPLFSCPLSVAIVPHDPRLELDLFNRVRAESRYTWSKTDQLVSFLNFIIILLKTQQVSDLLGLATRVVNTSPSRIYRLYRSSMSTTSLFSMQNVVSSSNMSEISLKIGISGYSSRFPTC